MQLTLDWDYVVNTILRYMQQGSYEILHVEKVKKLFSKLCTYSNTLFKKINGIPVVVQKWVEYGHVALSYKHTSSRCHLFLAFERTELPKALSQRASWVITSDPSRAKVTHSEGSELNRVTKKEDSNEYYKNDSKCS